MFYVNKAGLTFMSNQTLGRVALTRLENLDYYFNMRTIKSHCLVLIMIWIKLFWGC